MKGTSSAGAFRAGVKGGIGEGFEEHVGGVKNFTAITVGGGVLEETFHSMHIFNSGGGLERGKETYSR